MLDTQLSFYIAQWDSANYTVPNTETMPGGCDSDPASFYTVTVCSVLPRHVERGAVIERHCKSPYDLCGSNGSHAS